MSSTLIQMDPSPIAISLRRDLQLLDNLVGFGINPARGPYQSSARPSRIRLPLGSHRVALGRDGHCDQVGAEIDAGQSCRVPNQNVSASAPKPPV